MTDTQLGMTLMAIVILFTLAELWHLRNKFKPRYEYYRGLCKSLHYFNEKATEIEQMIQMIYDIENTPRRERKNLTIAIPDTLTREVNSGKFSIKRVRDSDIFIKIIDKQCAEACTLLTEQLDDAIRNGVIFSCDTINDENDMEAGESESIEVFDHQQGEYTI